MCYCRAKMATKHSRVDLTMKQWTELYYTYDVFWVNHNLCWLCNGSLSNWHTVIYGVYRGCHRIIRHIINPPKFPMNQLWWISEYSLYILYIHAYIQSNGVHRIWSLGDLLKLGYIWLNYLVIRVNFSKLGNNQGMAALEIIL